MNFAPIKPRHLAVCLFFMMIVACGIRLYHTRELTNLEFTYFTKLISSYKNNDTQKSSGLGKEIKTDQTPFEETNMKYIATTTTQSTREPVSVTSKSVLKYIHLSRDEVFQLNQALQNANERMTILIWESMYGVKENISINESECGACDFTYDRSKISGPTTKAVVFHFTAGLGGMPHTRRPEQFYVWWTREGTRAIRVFRGNSLRQYDGGFFNLTMTYRQDSDVYDPYDTASILLKRLQDRGSGNMSKQLDELIGGKNRSALWVVSNCGATRGAKQRMQIVNNLEEAGLNIDRSGACFPKGKPIPRIHAHEIIPQYKFYLSFENNLHCKDYITEKLFLNALEYGALPVVWGGTRGDYQLIAPPNSYIFVEDFKTPKDLVDYLNYLDKNETAYRSYFAWRLMKLEEMPNYLRAMRWCALCKTVHGINNDQLFNPEYDSAKSKIPLYGHVKSRTVPSLADWFYGLENQDCAN